MITQSVGKSVPHDAAVGHVRGNAHYLDDLPKLQGELHVGFVGSPIASGKLVHVDFSKASAVPGVVRCFSVDDVPGHNTFGIVVFDEPFLATQDVLYIGQPIVVIAAQSLESLEKAKKLVEVDCDKSIFHDGPRIRVY